MSYLDKSGKHQELYEKHIAFAFKNKKRWTSQGELFDIFHKIYTDFFKIGYKYWYHVIYNNDLNKNYVPPEDAPKVVKDFFKPMKEEFEAYTEQKRMHDMGSAENTFQPDVLSFTSGKLEKVMDSVIVYVDKKDKQLVKVSENPKKKSVKKPVDAKECKILNPDSGKYVNLHGPTAIKILKKYAPGLFPKN